MGRRPRRALGRAGLVTELLRRQLAHDLAGAAADGQHLGLAKDALDRLRRREVAVSPAVIDLLLKSADVMRGQIEWLARGAAPPPADPALIAELHRLAGGAVKPGVTATDADGEPEPPRFASQSSAGTKTS